jgi:hypothetical protein
MNTHGDLFDIAPLGFLLPMEYSKFVDYYSSQATKKIWICKPTDLSRGRKIFLLRDLTELTYDQHVVIQQYVDRPLTIGGYKHDLRVYCLVNHVHPLQAYIYEEGIVRFSTQKYSVDGKVDGDIDIKNLFSHLTNSSINKNSPTLNAEKEVVGAGCKWTFAQYKRWFEENATVKFELIWSKIISIVRCTLAILLTNVDYNGSSFELFGFDIMLSDDYRPWILEVNCSPALGVDCDVDTIVKIPLLNDMFDILGIEKDADGTPSNTKESKVEGKELNSERKIKVTTSTSIPPILNKPSLKTTTGTLKKTKDLSRISSEVGDNSLPGRQRLAGKASTASPLQYRKPPIKMENFPEHCGNFTRVMPVNATALEANINLINLKERKGKSDPLMEQEQVKIIINEIKRATARDIKSYSSVTATASADPLKSQSVPKVSSSAERIRASLAKLNVSDLKIAQSPDF